MANEEYFICERCTKKFKLDVGKINQAFKAWSENMTIRGQLANFCGAKCPFCNGIETFHVDAYIADCIIMLLQKGYVSLSCCSSHTSTSIWHNEGNNLYVTIMTSEPFIEWWIKQSKISKDWLLELCPNDEIFDRGMTIKNKMLYHRPSRKTIMKQINELITICEECPDISKPIN